jgi:hypothetical protein
MKSRKRASRAAVDPTGALGSREPRATGLSAEEIQRAYEIYVERGRVDGHDFEDWRQAENELRENLRTRQSA